MDARYLTSARGLTAAGRRMHGPHHLNKARTNHSLLGDTFTTMRTGAGIVTRFGCCAVRAGGTIPAWQAVIIVAFCVAIIIGVFVFGAGGRGGMRGGDDLDGGGDGPGGRDPGPPQPGGGASKDPDWWPEFERQFAAYVATRRRAASQRSG
jgi:hypothetical protein